MTGVPSSDLKAYFAEARRWDQDRLSAAIRSRRLAWTVAACLLLGLCLLRGLPVPVEPQVIAGILGMGVLVQGLGHGLITWAVCRFSPLFVATCCLGDPVLGSLWGLVYFEEQLGPLVLLGGCLIGAAILLGSRAELHGKSAGPAPATAPHHT